jgi:4-amino-4-deoxy-L-arabinose transferase-like glycosyltransferase
LNNSLKSFLDYKIILVFCIGLLPLAYPLFSEGMFMDGVIYAALANNLAQGNGSFWELGFSETIFNSFREHPPLAIYLESWFHQLFSGSYLSERIYSFLTWLINGFLIVSIWKNLKLPNHISWAPILIWSLMPVVFWCFSNNMLENTMGIFISLSVLFFIKSNSSPNKFIYLFLFGCSVFLAFLSKGFTGMYTLALPFVFFIFHSKSNYNFTRMVIDSFVIVASMLFCFFIMFYFRTASFDYLQAYFENQILYSVNSEQTVKTRFQIVIDFILAILPFVALLLILKYFLKSKINFTSTEYDNKWIKTLTLIALLGVIPIMISLKQRSFYILTVYPFVAISIAIYFKSLFEYINQWFENFKYRSLVTFTLPLVTLGLIIFSSQKIGRDENEVKDIKSITKITGGNLTIGVSNEIRYDWSVIAYFSRYGNISLDVNNTSHTYFVSRKETQVELPDFNTKTLLTFEIYTAKSDSIHPNSQPQ